MRFDLGTLGLLALASTVSASVKYLGVAISGIDFGCDIDGSCPLKGIAIPLNGYGGGDGKAQMEHFTKDSGMNVFRLPVTWQFLLNNTQTIGPLDKTNLEAYDALVQACLDTGAYCMIDLHNFGRFDGGIIGQGGPSNQVFADFWSQLAKKYADEDRIIFGLMNEPHDLDVNLWAQTCQAAVTAIRKAGAKTQMILLPGTNFTSAESFVSTGSAAALANVTNPDGSFDNLYMDLHKYLDINNSGSHAECTTNNVQAFTNIADWLRTNKRQAIISETGASMDPSCMTDFCAQNDAIAKNSDVLIGFVAWGAGSFDQTYILTLTPTGKPGDYVDNKLMKQCILEPFNVDLTPTPPKRPTSTSSTSTASSSPTAAADSSRTSQTSQSARPLPAAGDSSQPSQGQKGHNAGGRTEAPFAGLLLAGWGFLYMSRTL